VCYLQSVEELNLGPPNTNPSSGREDLNSGPPHYKSSALTTRPHRLPRGRVRRYHEATKSNRSTFGQSDLMDHETRRQTLSYSRSSG